MPDPAQRPRVEPISDEELRALLTEATGHDIEAANAAWLVLRNKAFILARELLERRAPVLQDEEVERLRRAAQEVLYWIGNLPSRDAIVAAANEEHNQVYSKGDEPWHVKSEETKRHWLNHVGPAVRAAWREELRLASPPIHPLQKLKASVGSASTGGMYPTKEQIEWLRDCNEAGFDPVLEIQKLRSEIQVVKLKNDELLTGWVPPAFWPQEAWDVLIERHFTDRVEIGEKWVLFQRPPAALSVPQEDAKGEVDA